VTDRATGRALAALLVLAAGQRLWNAWAVAPLNGYDAPGHVAYMLTILADHRLPHPTEGWSTFHPPLYYLAGSLVWAALEPLGPHAILFGIRCLGAAASLVLGIVTFALARRLGAEPQTALVATALALFVPCVQMAAVMEGNEAVAAGLVAIALPALLRLQETPRDTRAAAVVGAAAGLALITKFSSVALLPAAAVPFLRRDLDAGMRRALVVLVLFTAAIAAPVYGRNLLLTGSAVPMTRTREPIRTAERALTLRGRAAADYVRLDPACLVRPSLFHVAGVPGSIANRNRAMVSVPGLLHASAWWDPFAIRVPLASHRDGIRSGPVLAFLGLAPSLAALLGFVLAAAAAVRGRLRAPDAPLVVLAVASAAAFVAFTWTAPTAASVKASYMLSLVPAVGAFFGRGVAVLGRRLGRLVLAVSLAAAAFAAIALTEGVLFRSVPPSAHLWGAWARRLPGTHLADVLARFLAS
jgi:hypothetical protein